MIGILHVSTLSIAIASAILGGCAKTEKDAEPSVALAPSSVAKAASAQFVRPPGFGYYEVDPKASTIVWEARKITAQERGSFSAFTGHIELLEPIDAPRLELSIDMASVHASSDKLAAHLRSPDFFDVAKFPISHFRLTSALNTEASPSNYAVTGELTLHGVTRAISFPAQVTIGEDDHVKATADVVINRKDFAIVYPGLPDDLIRDEVTVHLAIDAIKRK